MEPIGALREQHISKMVENGDYIPFTKKPLGNGIRYDVLEQLIQLENVSVHESYIKSKEKERYSNNLYEMIENEIEYQSQYKWPYSVSPYFFPYESYQFINYYSDADESGSSYFGIVISEDGYVNSLPPSEFPPLIETTTFPEKESEPIFP